MTCIKTGARVYLPDYNTAAPADLFEIGDAIICRFNGDPRRFDGSYVKEKPANTTHVLCVNPPEHSWIRWDLGTIVVKREMTLDCQRGGHIGED